MMVLRGLKCAFYRCNLSYCPIEFTSHQEATDHFEHGDSTYVSISVKHRIHTCIGGQKHPRLSLILAIMTVEAYMVVQIMSHDLDLLTWQK